MGGDHNSGHNNSAVIYTRLSCVNHCPPLHICTYTHLHTRHTYTKSLDSPPPLSLPSSLFLSLSMSLPHLPLLSSFLSLSPFASLRFSSSSLSLSFMFFLFFPLFCSYSHPLFLFSQKRKEGSKERARATSRGRKTRTFSSRRAEKREGE